VGSCNNAPRDAVCATLAPLAAVSPAGVREPAQFQLDQLSARAEARDGRADLVSAQPAA
jgi:hypothetical protein